MTLAEQIKRRRKALHKTQDDIAKIVNVTKQTIQKYENGIISNIPSDKIELLARALECSPAYLMGWEDAEPSSKETICDSLVSDFLDLSEEDQQKAIEYVKLLKKAAE